jgi:hypothetical protein
MATSESPTTMGASSPETTKPQSSAQFTMEEAKSTKEEAKKIANDASRTAKAEGKRMAAQAKEEARAYVENTKNSAASTIDDVAQATREAAETLRQRHDGAAARYTEAAADEAEDLARYLREHNPMEMLDDLSHAARRHPGAVFGGLFLAGLAVSRFLRSSARPGDQSPKRADFSASRPNESSTTVPRGNPTTPGSPTTHSS